MRRIFLLILLTLLVVTAGIATYKWSQSRSKRRQLQTSNPSNAAELLSSPPFSTKEPQRYQAVRVITTITSSGGTLETRMLIARDGDSRREVYDPGAESETIHFQTATSSFVALTARRIYADLNAAIVSNDDNDSQDIDSAPDRMLHQGHPEMRYENLGSETFSGHRIIKYRITSPDTEANATETTVWIDDLLGMPIKTETVAGNERFISELRDIELNIDPKLFELPKDYKKVSLAELRSQIPRK